MKNIIVCLAAITFLLLACNSGEDKKKLILGTWQFSKMEKDGKEIGASENEKKDHSTFENNGNFISVRGEDSRKGKYELLDNGSVIITKMESQERWDTMKVLELNSTTFKILTNDRETVTLKKIQ